jgi:predicted RNA-binding protein YlqC (UPF0109 family)
MSQSTSTLYSSHEKNTDSAAIVLAGIVKSLVKHPDNVRVHTKVRDGGVVFVLEVTAEDIESVVGRNCRTLASLKTIVSAISIQTDLSVSLDIRAAHA